MLEKRCILLGVACLGAGYALATEPRAQSPEPTML